MLQSLAASRQRRRRRSSRAPQWIIRLHRAGRQISQFLRVSLPAAVRQRRMELKTAGISFIIHSIVALLLAIWIIRTQNDFRSIELIVAQLPPGPNDSELSHILQPEVLVDLEIDSTTQRMLAEFDRQQDQATERDISDQLMQNPLDVVTLRMEIPDNAGPLAGRSLSGRRAALRRYGGTAESERAVNAGLKWLQSIQRPDGSWSFGQTGDADGTGSMDKADTAATSMALLCFLGAGHEHQTDGPYRTVVRNGLIWLATSAVRNPTGADLRGTIQGNSGMYAQGLAAICICEASALVPADKELRRLAIECIAFVERSQDRDGGGWRYFPGQAGDMSVTGWQLMALQSARMGGVRVSGSVLRRAREFLNSVQADGGSAYGYTRPQEIRNPSMSAVGLLCRIYMGWKRDHDGLMRGVHRLAAIGPSVDDMYYNYYATQVMHHFGGPVWDQWNATLRPQLVESQVQEGPAAGSWDITDPHGSSGGRLYQTALCILTLEVYYRHLPIYRDPEIAAAGSDAPGD